MLCFIIGYILNFIYWFWLEELVSIFVPWAKYPLLFVPHVVCFTDCLIWGISSEHIAKSFYYLTLGPQVACLHFATLSSGVWICVLNVVCTLGFCSVIWVIAFLFFSELGQCFQKWSSSQVKHFIFGFDHGRLTLHSAVVCVFLLCKEYDLEFELFISHMG